MKSGNLSNMVSVVACIIFWREGRLNGGATYDKLLPDGRMNCTRLETLIAPGMGWQTNVDNWEKQEIVERKERNNTKVTSPQEMQS